MPNTTGSSTPSRRIVMPAASASRVDLSAGQRLRIVEVEGPQSVDVIAFSRENLKETLSVWLSRQMSRSFTRADALYSSLPAGRLMFTVNHAPVECFWLSPGRCNPMMADSATDKAGVTSCQDLLAHAVHELGLSPFEVPEVLNLFMSARFGPDGTYELRQSPVSPGDYVELTAEMDTIVMASACPRIAPYNQNDPRQVVLEVWD